MAGAERVNIPGYVDHSFLGPERGLEELERFCDECLEYKFASA
jgi:deoxyribose-phosphate aldolase